MLQRLRIANYNRDRLSPEWTRQFWNAYTNHDEFSTIDTVVIGNTGEVADAMIAETLFSVRGKARVTVVLDIAATVLRADDLFEYDAIIGPSHYAHFVFKSAPGRILLILFFRFTLKRPCPVPYSRSAVHLPPRSALEFPRRHSHSNLSF